MPDEKSPLLKVSLRLTIILTGLLITDLYSWLVRDPGLDPISPTTYKWLWRVCFVLLTLLLVSLAYIYDLRRKLKENNIYPKKIDQPTIYTSKEPDGEPEKQKSEKDNEKELYQARMKLLKNLSGGEKRMLKNYLDDDTKTQMFHIGDGGPAGLARKGILFLATRVSQHMSFAYNISEWAWEMLKDHPELLE